MMDVRILNVLKMDYYSTQCIASPRVFKMNRDVVIDLCQGEPDISKLVYW